MSLYLKTTAGAFTAWTGQRINNVSHPRDIARKWSEADLNVIGLHSLVDADPVPDGFEVIGSAVQDVAGRPKTVHDLRPVPALSQGELDAARILQPARFAWLLGYTGLDKVWSAMEAYAEAQGDRSLYAGLVAQRASAEFNLQRTLETLASLRPVTDQVAPDADLAPETIREAWALAEAATF
jgi:hypothetical protein